MLGRVNALADDSTSHRLHWDSLTEFFSIARLAQAEERWADAYAALSRGVELSIVRRSTLGEENAPGSLQMLGKVRRTDS